MDGYPSGQRGLTVNQMAEAFGGSNPSPSTQTAAAVCGTAAHIAQMVEHGLGKTGVLGSNPNVGFCRVKEKNRKIAVKENKHGETKV